MATPDVRVRLSAEGTAEVIAAFRKVQLEAQRSGKASAKAFSGFGSSIAGLRGVLGALAGAVAAVGIARLVNEASEAAEQLQNLRLRFAGTVADLSALSVAARQSGSDLGTLSRPLTKLFADMVEASKDLSGEAADRFRDFGLSAKQIQAFAKQDLAARLETLSKAFAAMPDPIERSNAAIALLGGRGAALIPIMDRIGKEGFVGLHREGARLSSLMSEEMVEAAGAVNDSFDDLKIQTQGLATQFVTGLAPGLTAGIRAMTTETSKGAQGWRLLGEIIGEVLGFTITLTTTAADSIHTRFTTLAANIASAFRAVAAAVTGNFDEAQVHLESIGLRREREERLLAERVNRAWDEFHSQEDVRARARTDANAEALEDQGQREEASTKARLAARRAGLDADLALVKAGLKLREQWEEDAFREGRRSLEEFYAARRRIIVTGINAEIAALQQQRALASADKEKGLAEVRKIDGQIAVLAIEREDQLAALAAKEAEEARRLAQERLELDRKVFEARGEQHAATLLSIDEEIQKAEELLAKLGGDEGANRRALADLRTALTTAAEFDRVSGEASRALSDLARDRAAVERRAEAGLLSQAEAERQIRALEEERIERLRRLAGELERAAEATGDPDRLGRARDFAAGVDEVSVSIHRQDEELRELGRGGVDIARQALGDFLGTGIREAPTFASAIGSMAASVGASVQRLIGEFIALRIVSGFLSAFGGGAGAGDVRGLVGQVPDVLSAAGGGAVPGSGTGDIQPAMLEPGEFVTRRAVVAQAGVRSFLEALNAGHAHVVPPPRGIRHFAEGGFVDSGPASAARFEGLLTLGLDDGLILRKMESAAGDRLIVRSLARNRRAAGRALGGQ